MVRSSPCVWNDNFCVGSYDGVVYCFTSRKGGDNKPPDDNEEIEIPATNKPDTVLWESVDTNIFKHLVGLTPDGNIIVKSGNISCLDGQTGETLWRFEKNNNLAFVIGNTVAVFGDQFVCGLDADDGQVIYEVNLENLQTDSDSEEKQFHIKIDNTVFIKSGGKYIAINLSTGEVDGEIKLKDIQTPILKNQQKIGYIEDGTIHVISLKPGSGIQSFTLDTSDEKTKGFVEDIQAVRGCREITGWITNEILYLSTNTGNIDIIDLEGGRVRERYTGIISSTTNKNCLFISDKTTLACIDKSDGNIKWHIKRNKDDAFDPIATAGDELIVRSNRHLLSIDVKTRKTNWIVRLPHKPLYQLRQTSILFDGKRFFTSSSQYVTCISSGNEVTTKTIGRASWCHNSR